MWYKIDRILIHIARTSRLPFSTIDNYFRCQKVDADTNYCIFIFITLFNMITISMKCQDIFTLISITLQIFRSLFRDYQIISILRAISTPIWGNCWCWLWSYCYWLASRSLCYCYHKAQGMEHFIYWTNNIYFFIVIYFLIILMMGGGPTKKHLNLYKMQIHNLTQKMMLF